MGKELVFTVSSLPQSITGVKITGGPWARGPYLGCRAPRSTGLGARQAPRNFRGLNIENVKDIDISTPWPTESDGGP